MNLILREEPGGYRHYLDGRPVHCGAQLELHVGGPDGAWLPVRYEADLGDCPRVTLHACGGIIEPGRDATFRWPAMT
ncbi:MAG: hypothetical protein IPK15_27405 [Verrucomicrobia bacterium]|nr:hypothetical protein [Verrucomicrobiota bacterium]